MGASAAALGSLGLVGSFLPRELLTWAGAPAWQPLSLLVQLVAALYLGFAALNWMTRHNLIGGIYSRPVAIANLLHFVTAGLAMTRLLAASPDLSLLWPLTILYALFAGGFGIVLFRHPVPRPILRETPPRLGGSSG